MQLKNTSVRPPADMPGRLRLYGEVVYDDPVRQPEEYWFDVPEGYADYLSDSGNPWLACLIPLAVTLGEPLRLCRPVDRRMFDGVQQLMRIWKCWYPHLHIVPIEVDLVNMAGASTPSQTAVFFSGGVDSLFSTLRYSEGAPLSSPPGIDDLIFVWGFDIPLQNGEAFARVRDSFKRASAELHKELVDVATSLRTTYWRLADWGLLAHGCGLISTGLVLEKRYCQLLVASSDGYFVMHPWGSHPVTDPLLSTNCTKVIHDGATFDRVEKTELVASSEVARRYLRVCWRSGTDQNCGSCEKCYRTMLTLELLGALNRCPTFRGKRLDVARASKMYYPPAFIPVSTRQVRAFALRKGRVDIAEAIDRAIRRSLRLNRWLRLVRRLKSMRFLWRWTVPLERALLRSALQ